MPAGDEGNLERAYHVFLFRSLPSFVDGFKPTQRKILFCAFKRKLKSDIKVAQLAGYVSEHGAYHHGETSLEGAIISMAQGTLIMISFSTDSSKGDHCLFH